MNLHDKVSGEVEIRRLRNACRLIGELAAVIEGSDYTYEETLCALKELSEHYAQKGRDFLNGVSIQEVSKKGALIDP